MLPGKALAQSSAGSPCACSAGRSTLKFTLGVAISDWGASDARSDDIVLAMPSLSIVTVSLVIDKRWYRPSSRGSNFEYK